MPPGSTKRCKTAMALTYRRTYDNLLKKLCSGPLLHVDETGISVKGYSGCVWVLASAEDATYFYTHTREGVTIQGLLKDFRTSSCPIFIPRTTAFNACYKNA